MSEYLTEGVVLEKEPYGEVDYQVLLFTKDLGKIYVKMKSGRKITSKLNSHLEPLNKVVIRIIEKNGFQVVDALRFGRYSNKLVIILSLVSKITVELQPDLKMWQILKLIPNDRDPKDIRILIKKILGISGFGTDFSTCYNCGRKSPKTFIFESAQFVCGLCLSHSQIRVEAVISI